MRWCWCDCLSSCQYIWRSRRFGDNGCRPVPGHKLCSCWASVAFHSAFPIPSMPYRAVPVSNASSRGSSGIIAAWWWPFFRSYITALGQGSFGLVDSWTKTEGQTDSSFGRLVLLRYFLGIIAAWPNAQRTLEYLGLDKGVNMLIDVDSEW